MPFFWSNELWGFVYLFVLMLNRADLDLPVEEKCYWLRHLSLSPFTWVSWVFNHKYWLSSFITQLNFNAISSYQDHNINLIWFVKQSNCFIQMSKACSQFISLHRKNFIPRLNQSIGVVTLVQKAVAWNFCIHWFF